MAEPEQAVCVDCEPPTTQVLNGRRAEAHPAPSAYDVMDPATFSPPDDLPLPRVVIEYCDRCRWQHRASWTQTELLLTFAPSETLPAGLRSVTVLPRRDEVEAGRWRVWLYRTEARPDLVWDRKVDGGFGEMKELKKRVRDLVAPGASLGHSDGHKAA